MQLNNAGLGVLGVLAAVTLGCGGDGYRMAPVSGTVMLDGAPLPNASVTFSPSAKGQSEQAGPGSYGRTNEQGKYSLKRIDTDANGALVGNHRVEIAVDSGEEISDAGSPGSANPLAHYRNTLTFEVLTEGTDAANFDLTSKKD